MCSRDISADTRYYSSALLRLFEFSVGVRTVAQYQAFSFKNNVPDMDVSHIYVEGFHEKAGPAFFTVFRVTLTWLSYCVSPPLISLTVEVS